MPAAPFIDVTALEAIVVALAGFGIVAIFVILHRLVRHGQAAGLVRLRPQAPAAVANEMRLMRAVLDALPEPVQVLDARGRIVLANAAGQRLATAGDKGEVTWRDLGLGDLGGKHALRVGRDESDVDIAEIEEARARAEAANEAKSRFLATVSHEFRTPLNGILGMTRLLVETGLDAEQTTYAQAVKSSAEAFLSLVDDMLDMAMIEAGRIALADEPFDLVSLTQGVAELLAPRAQGKGTEIASYIGPGVPRTVRGDADRLRQVLINLAGNAVKFTRTGGVGIRIERSDDGRIAFCVEDTGPGIAPEEAATIFEEFEQAGPASDGESGTGLGLAITRRLVERMGGSIALDSTPGIGSRFHFALDLPTADAETPHDKSPTGTGRRVLILSRSAFEAGYLARVIADTGGRARVVKGLGEAVDAMGCESFDVLVADHALPDEDVRVAVSEARRRGLSRTVVMLSPFERHDLGSPHAAGFDAYLIKPVRARSLLEQIADAPRVAAPTAASRRPAQPMRSASRPRRVLLVEDNEINALLAMKTLEGLGAIVEWSRNGEGALARLQATLHGEDAPIDLVLMDLRMPDLDGREVTRRIRQEEARLGVAWPLRIVALTASVVGNPDAMIREAGFDALLAKPLHVEALTEEIDSVRRRAV
ncbi:ATP-binding protein [Enterovirga rhinocerotis]|uniref:histidine kinase n=1 Tax=Enterovirga rhinocerotis TaxID=1339210 RepID=A0A4R7C4G4_9HYPH|nr:ATP-binding protein [Enterovirga rhinocerotis]TDR93430.1 signal transduction histidine kinase [Enterovirga rhinocerotis]